MCTCEIRILQFKECDYWTYSSTLTVSRVVNPCCEEEMLRYWRLPPGTSKVTLKVTSKNFIRARLENHSTCVSELLLLDSFMWVQAIHSNRLSSVRSTLARSSTRMCPRNRRIQSRRLSRPSVGCQSVKQSVNQSVSQSVSHCFEGGAMGLWTGASIVTWIHLIYFCCVACVKVG